MDRNPTSGKETGYTQSVCLCFLTYSPGQCLAISSLRIMGERRAFVSRGIGTRHEGNKNKDGVRNSHTSHAEVMFSLDGKPQENAGCVIGAALCYSGNYKLRIDTHDDEYHRFFAGINEENSAYSLKKDEIFRTPELALTYSNEGLSGSSRNFHRWARLHKLAHGTVPARFY